MFTPRDYFEFDFKDHYREYYAETGLPFSTFEPAYRHGYDMVYGYRYRNRCWEALERDAQAEWERRYRSLPWGDVRDAVRYAWEYVKDRSHIG